MNRDVKITIQTIQIQDGQSNEMKFKEQGQYFLKGDHHYVLYEEKVEGSAEAIHNRIKFSEKFMQVTKKGALSSDMYFEMNKNYSTEYKTPFGKMDMEIHTHDYYMKSTGEGGITIGVNYDLNAQYGLLANCQMQIIINEAE